MRDVPVRKTRTTAAKAHPAKAHPYVALLIDTSMTWCTRVILGIRDYAAEHGPWTFHIQPRGRFEERRLPKSWDGDGVLARAPTIEDARYLLGLGIPVVSVSTSDPTGGRLPRCSVDIREVGRLAAEHFTQRGFRQFGYVATSERRDRDPDLMHSGFAGALEAGAHGVHEFNFRRLRWPGNPYDVFSPELARWLRELPKPIGLLAWNAAEGRRVVEACRLAAIRVPEEIAILTGEYDEISCELASPPLSSVDCSARTVGYQAAAILGRMLRGEKPPAAPLLVQPTGILQRQSSDIVAIDDDHLARALAYIREHATGNITVTDVARQASLSRRTLELRFRALLGRSPAEEIRQARLRHAKELLQKTNFTISRIASASGFSTDDILQRNFQRAFGASPSQYRQDFHKRK